MTRYELMELLGLKNYAPISRAYGKAKKAGALPRKKTHLGPCLENDMSLETILIICRFMWKNRKLLVEEWIKEHYIKHEKPKVTKFSAKMCPKILFEKSESLIKHPKQRCCSTCMHVIAKTMVKKQPIYKPWCTQTKMFCGKMGMNPYTDYDCPYYRRTDGKPKLWLRASTIYRGDKLENFEIMEHKPKKIKTKREVEWNLPDLLNSFI